MVSEQEIWSERYRPDSLDDVIGQENQVNKLKDFLEDGSIPHLLLHGPPGTAKTASVVAFAKDKYGDDWNGNLIEMNASDDRGIDIVREEIKQKAAQAPIGGYDYKIIYLDEADQLTNAAQAALRRIIEKFSDQTRFFLSCNYKHKIIDPIQSRCTPLPFSSLSDEDVQEILVNILENENVEYHDSAVSEIVEHAEGDARDAVQTLQLSVENGVLSEDVINLVGGQADQEDVEKMMVKAVAGDMDSAMNINVRQVQPDVIDHSRFAGQVMEVLRNCEDIDRDVRFYAMSQLGDVERNVLEGSNPEVQWNSFLAQLPVIQHASIPSYSDSDE